MKFKQLDLNEIFRYAFRGRKRKLSKAEKDLLKDAIENAFLMQDLADALSAGDNSEAGPIRGETWHYRALPGNLASFKKITYKHGNLTKDKK
jgi:hypothetical protein